MINIEPKNIHDLPDHTILKFYREEVTASLLYYLDWKQAEVNDLNIMTLETEILNRMKGNKNE